MFKGSRMQRYNEAKGRHKYANFKGPNFHTKEQTNKMRKNEQNKKAFHGSLGPKTTGSRNHGSNVKQNPESKSHNSQGPKCHGPEIGRQRKRMTHIEYHATNLENLESQELLAKK